MTDRKPQRCPGCGATLLYGVPPCINCRRAPVAIGADLAAGRPRDMTVLYIDGSVSSVAGRAIEMIAERDAAGQAKYGTSMDRTDLKPGAWLRHAIEEHADALQYQLRLARDLEQLVRKAFQAGRDSVLSSLGAADYATAIDLRNQEEIDETVKELLG